MRYDGMKLRDELALRGYSVDEFAEMAGVSRISVYRALDSGKATIKTQGKFAAALGIEKPRDLLLFEERLDD